MKKVFTLAALLLSGMMANAESVWTIAPIELESAKAGDTGYMDLLVFNEECDVASIGGDMYFPIEDGFVGYVNSSNNTNSQTLVRDESRMTYTYYDEAEEDDVTATCMTDLQIKTVKNEDGTIRFFRIGSTGQYSLKGTSGRLCQIKYKITKDMAPGYYPIYIKDANTYSLKGDPNEFTDQIVTYVKVGNPTDAELELKGIAVSAVTEALSKTGNVKMNMEGVTSGNLILSDGCGISALPTSATFSKVSYSRSSLASKYGTICVPVELKSDSKIQYYTISAAEEGSITIEAVSTLPAGTPAIYENKGATAIEASEENVTLAAAGTTGTGAELVGTYAKTKIDAPNTYYLKSDKFNRVNGNFFSGNFKAYAQSSEALAKALEIFVADDDATAINGASKSASIEAIYNAAGAQNKKLEKGVNILKMSDGSIKKVLVK